MKSEIAAAIQYGNYRVATKAIQQSKPTLKIPHKTSGVDDFLSALMEGEKTVPKNISKSSNVLNEKINQTSVGNKTPEEIQDKEKRQKNGSVVETNENIVSENGPAEIRKVKAVLRRC